jgi:hypothetical protein
VEGGRDLPRFLVLNQEEKCLKFNKGVIVKSKMMNRDKIFVARWNMEDTI